MSSPIGNQEKVKTFILFLMENVGYPLDYVELNDIVLQNDYVLYMDFAEGFNELCDLNLIESVCEKSQNGEEVVKYQVTDKGRHAARTLKGELLPDILERSLACALRYLDFRKRGIRYDCSISQLTDDFRYRFSCEMKEKDVVIFSTVLVVDTYDRALGMQKNFYDRLDAIYRGTVALLSGNVNYLFD